MPEITTYLSEKDFERLKLQCLMRKITIYRYVQECIHHALKQSVDYLLEDNAKKKKSWMNKMPIIDLDS